MIYIKREIYFYYYLIKKHLIIPLFYTLLYIKLYHTINIEEQKKILLISVMGLYYYHLNKYIIIENLFLDHIKNLNENYLKCMFLFFSKKQLIYICREHTNYIEYYLSNRISNLEVYKIIYELNPNTLIRSLTYDNYKLLNWIIYCNDYPCLEYIFKIYPDIYIQFDYLNNSKKDPYYYIIGSSFYSFKKEDNLKYYKVLSLIYILKNKRLNTDINKKILFLLRPDLTES